MPGKTTFLSDSGRWNGIFRGIGPQEREHKSSLNILHYLDISAPSIGPNWIREDKLYTNVIAEIPFPHSRVFCIPSSIIGRIPLNNYSRGYYWWKTKPKKHSTLTVCAPRYFIVSLQSLQYQITFLSISEGLSKPSLVRKHFHMDRTRPQALPTLSPASSKTRITKFTRKIPQE